MQHINHTSMISNSYGIHAVTWCWYSYMSTWSGIHMIRRIYTAYDIMVCALHELTTSPGNLLDNDEN